MILDSEEQRSILLQTLDYIAPRSVRDAGPDSLASLAALAEVRRAVVAATVDVPE